MFSQQKMMSTQKCQLTEEGTLQPRTQKTRTPPLLTLTKEASKRKSSMKKGSYSSRPLTDNLNKHLALLMKGNKLPSKSKTPQRVKGLSLSIHRGHL